MPAVKRTVALVLATVCLIGLSQVDSFHPTHPLVWATMNAIGTVYWLHFALKRP